MNELVFFFSVTRRTVSARSSVDAVCGEPVKDLGEEQDRKQTNHTHVYFLAKYRECEARLGDGEACLLENHLRADCERNGD